MAATTSSGTPVPTLGDLPNVPADMLRMATYLEPITAPRFTSDANASLGLPGRLVGQQALVNGIRKKWNGSIWVPCDSELATSGGFAMVGTLPANTQLRWTGGMGVTNTNAGGHISVATGFSTCILTAWCGPADTGQDIIGVVDALTAPQVSSLTTRWKQRATGTFLVNTPVRLVWGALGI